MGQGDGRSARQVEISAAALASIVAHARREAPRECCGILIGRGPLVVDWAASPNLADDPTRQFLIDPAAHIAALRRARVTSLEVVGFFHSHPRSGATPSAADRDGATYAEHLYLVVGLGTEPPDVGLFRLDRGNFEAVEFVTRS